MKRSDLRKIKVIIRDKNGKITYNYIGYFHKWIYSENKYLLAIVEKEDGSVRKIDYNNIHFIHLDPEVTSSLNDPEVTSSKILNWR